MICNSGGSCVNGGCFTTSDCANQVCDDGECGIDTNFENQNILRVCHEFLASKMRIVGLLKMESSGRARSFKNAWIAMGSARLYMTAITVECAGRVIRAIIVSRMTIAMSLNSV